MVNIFKWENQDPDQWPEWFKRAIEENGFFIEDNNLYLVTDEAGCGNGRYLIDPGDYAVKENDGSYSSRASWVIEHN